MKTRRNPFLATVTLVAATVLLAGQQAAFAIDYNLDTFTGFTDVWTTETIWNPDAGVGVGPVAADSVVISGKDLTGTTTINYATGSAATRGITNITVSDSANGSGSGANLIFGAGVTGSALQFSTTTPTVSTNIINQNSGGNRVNIENPLFQSGTTFTKGSVGNVQLKMTSADSVTSFNNNVSTLTSTGAGGTGALFLSATGAATAVTLPTISFSTNNTGLILASGTFTATDKTIALGTGRLVMGIGSTLNLTGSSTISGGVVTLGSTSSGDFNIGSGNSVINMNGATATFVDLLSTGLKGNVINTHNQLAGVTNISGKATLGNAGNLNATISNQTLAINISGGSFNFTRSATNTDFAVGTNVRDVSNPTGVVTVNGSVTVSATGLLDLGALTRIVLGTDTSTTADNITATLNLDGGTLKTAREILRGTNNGVGGTDSTLVKLNGGTLQTTADIPELFSTFGNTATNGILVSNGGAVIDTNGFDSGTAIVLQEDTASTGGGLTKNGTGTLTLGAVNTYTGATTVFNGKLSIGSAGTINSTSGVAIGAGEFNYNSSIPLSQGVSFSGTGGTLSGSGTITPAVTIATGNTVAPGDSIGTLSFGTGLTNNGTYACEIDTDGTPTADKLAVTGALNLTGSTLSLSNLGTATPAGGTKFTIATYTGTLTGTFTDKAEGATVTVSGVNYTIKYADGGNNITLTAPAAAGYSSWATTNGFGPDPGAVGADGITNLVKYALGLNNSAASYPSPGTYSGSTLTFTKGAEAKADTKIVYSIDESTDLIIWGAPTGTSPSGTVVNGADTITYTFPTTGPTRIFARLKVIQNP